MKGRRRFMHPVAAARQATRRRVDGRDEAGFTLIELIIVVAILPVVIGGISVALVSVLSLQSNVSGRLTSSGDAQVISANFDKDVQSAVQLTTDSTTTTTPTNTTQATQCGTGTQLLGLEWDANSTMPGGYDTVVSYVSVPNSNGTGYSLVRRECTAGISSTPSSLVVSHDIESGQAPPSIVPSSFATSAAAGWASTIGNLGLTVTFGITEPNSSAGNYTYSLVSSPEPSTSTGSLLPQSPPPTTSCGFATAGTGNSALCFIDFSGFDATAGGPCQPMSASITGTPYQLSFCVAYTGAPIAPHLIPTYYNPATGPGGFDSEAFMGNNGFYTGIPGEPALYQTTANNLSSTVTITNIKVTDAVGQAATGWELATGDAESTDTQEWLQWSTINPATGTGPNLMLIPNSTASPYGNACTYTTMTPPVDLTGLGTPTVFCGENVQLDHTGAVMLEALTPTNLTVTLGKVPGGQGGLQAMFLGLLLSS